MRKITTSDFGNKNINLNIIPLSLQDSIKRIIENEGYITCDAEARNFNSGGGSFIGELYEVDINGDTVEGAKKTNIFIKHIVTFNKVQYANISEAYLKEVFVYKDLSKIFTLLQNQAGVPPKERFKVPKAYDETSPEAIILENLSKRNFKTYDRLKVMPLKYAQLAIQEMAKFHGLSFIIEEKMPDYFQRNIKSLRHPFNYDEDWKCLVRNVCTHLAKLYDDDVKVRIEKFLQIFLEKYPKFGGYNKTVKCSLTHQDFRINNVLVKEQNGEAEEVVLIDYQVIDYGSPIRDFLFFVFSGSDQKFRRQHLNNLKELYFETFSKFLKYFDMEVENVYPRKEFDKAYTDWLDYGLMSVLFASVFLFAPDTGLDLENLSLSELPFCPDEIIEERLKELIDDFLEWGYL
ncbi:unnamed protein product [Euphydryas editha]|uniref:CHK kinase-like domain-containing protein n=1 Tax=Euphydryas editha TaxID=104508 RepID=A0AAU9TYX2_EUPED|nr:unnamed protein product [Euphydryas editha]